MKPGTLPAEPHSQEPFSWIQLISSGVFPYELNTTVSGAVRSLVSQMSRAGGTVQTRCVAAKVVAGTDQGSPVEARSIIYTIMSERLDRGGCESDQQASSDLIPG